MNIIYKSVIALCLAISLTACSTQSENPVTVSTAAMKTALVDVRTALAETQAVILATTPSPLPTFAVPGVTSTPAVSNPDGYVHPVPETRLDYAMAIAPKVYNRLPLIGETSLYGEYSGCTDTNDFSTIVSYGISSPFDTVVSAFEKYFQQEKWGFIEATTELAGDDSIVSQVSNDVYRILPDESSALERLQIVLRDESIPWGKDHVDVRIVLKHIETKSNFRYFGDIDCGELNNTWLWLRLVK